MLESRCLQLIPVLWCYSGQDLVGSSEFRISWKYGEGEHTIVGRTLCSFFYIRMYEKSQGQLKKKTVRKTSGVSAELSGAEELPKSRWCQCLTWPGTPVYKRFSSMKDLMFNLPNA